MGALTYLRIFLSNGPVNTLPPNKHASKPRCPGSTRSRPRPSRATLMSTNAGANVTLRAVILDPLSHKDPVTVVGTVVLVDLGIERMDLSHDGAKLAVQLDHLD